MNLLDQIGMHRVICGAVVIAALAGTGRTQAQGPELLQNGLVRVKFDYHTGLFDIDTASGSTLRIVESGPAVQKDGTTLSARDATSINVRRSNFEDQIGSGEKLVLQYNFSKSSFTFRYEISEYRDKPWISVTAYLPSGGYTLADVGLLKGTISVPEAFRARLYVSSGDTGGKTGVWQLGLGRWRSSAHSVYYDPRTHDGLGLAFYSFARAASSVTSQYFASNQIAVDAAAHYNGYQPRTGELKTESLLISFGRDPLRLLEDWADNVVKVVHPSFLHDTRSGLLNSWYIFGDEVTEAMALQQARILRDSVLFGYGITIGDTGEWQKQRHQYGDAGDALGFGEDQEDPRLFPHGVKWLSDQLHGMGFQVNFGANYAYAALESSIAQRNVPWIVREDRSRLGFGFPIDFTHPEARKWLADLVHRAVDYKAIQWCTDFDGGPTRGKLYDSTKIMGFEDIREGMKVTRSVLGPNVIIHKFCCGPYFTYLGLADRVRTGNDVAGVGDWDGLKAVARQLGATYMMHQRFWINDPDPIYVGGRDFVHNYGTGPIPADPAALDEIRMRLQFHVSTGGPPTIGENLEDLDPVRMRLLTLVLPSYGYAARPLDLFVHNTPEINDLSVKTGWDQWHVLMLQNWNDSDQEYDIRFSDLGLDPSRSYWIFRFWDQTFLGEFSQNVSLRVGARTGETYAIREVRRTPWVLGTDMHLTQGGVELEDVVYSGSELSGMARRQPGAEGHIVAFIPPGYKIRSASGPYSVNPEPSGASVVRLELKFGGEAATWSIHFEQPR